MRHSGFMDDVTFSDDIRRCTAEAHLTRSSGLGYKRCAGISVAGNGRTGLLLAVGLGGSSGGGVCGL